MNRAKTMIAVVMFLGMLTAAWTQEAEFRTVIVRNDLAEGGELHANVEFRLPGAPAAMTLASAVCHLRYSENLAAWPDDPAVAWAMGPDLGYVDSVIKRNGYYRIVINGNGVNASQSLIQPGDPAGWDADSTWQTLVTLRWSIVTLSAGHLTIEPDSLEAEYFLNPANAPQNGVNRFLIAGSLTKTEFADPCKASFIISPAVVEVGQPISFISESTGAKSYEWDFGDGSTATGYPISHVYTTPGEVSATLRITCEDGSRPSDTDVFTVLPAPPCLAAFTVSKTIAQVGERITFTSASSGALSYEWHFGDGSTGTRRVATHVYETAGTMLATLTITCYGGTDTSTPVEITITPPPSCKASFTTNPRVIEVGQTIDFISDSYGALTFNWDFGDGATATGYPMTHVYTTPGEKSATLRITCENQEKSSDTDILVVVASTCIPYFTYDPQAICVGTVVTFTGNPEAESWAWDFGDGTKESGQQISHTFAAADTYLVTLNTRCSGGRSGETSQQIIVLASPKADFIAAPTSGPAPLTVNLTDQSTGQPNAWTWDFGDGQQSHEQNPIHVYSTPGVYSVTLTVANACGSHSVVKENLIQAEKVIVPEYDYGTAALPPVRHLYHPAASIGAVVTSETAAADLSENDGIVLSDMMPGKSASLQVIVSQNGFISAWIDYDGNTTDWETNPPDNVVAAQSIAAGVQTTFTFVIPSTAPVSDQRWLRIRYSIGQLADVASAMGFSDRAYGEVQDYLFGLTPVELSSFTAVSNQGVIRLEWRTQSETENLGFLMYRAETRDGAYEQISEEMIPGAGTTATAHTYLFEDHNTTANQTYYYKLADVDYNGRLRMHGPVQIMASAPSEYRLEQNYPNPFNPETRLSFSLKEAGFTTLTIFNLNGQEIRSLIAKHLNAGSHSCSWDGKDQLGRTMSSGTYLYKLRINGFEVTKKMEFLK
ncbi:PKD domain-containing protein [bacterium]|nr:PKD domain-containing protein [bacterium]